MNTISTVAQKAEAVARVRETYGTWGIPVNLIPEGPMTLQHLHSILDLLEPRFSDVPCRFLSTSFDANDPELRAFPCRTSWEWRSVAHALTVYEPRGVMMRLPLFWQLEAPLHRACRQAKTSLFVNEPENMPVGAAAIYGAGIDTVVTTVEDAHDFSEYFNKQGLQLPKNWVVVHRADAPTWSVPDTLQQTNVYQEVHLLPGIPTLVQCNERAAKKIGFHISAEFVGEVADGKMFLTSLADDTFPFLDFEFPSSVQEQVSSCPCGKPTIERVAYRL